MTIDRLKRGQIWLADLNPTQGSEQAGVRPVIIFQRAAFRRKGEVPPTIWCYQCCQRDFLRYVA